MSIRKADEGGARHLQVRERPQWKRTQRTSVGLEGRGLASRTERK